MKTQGKAEAEGLQMIMQWWWSAVPIIWLTLLNILSLFTWKQFLKCELFLACSCGCFWFSAIKGVHILLVSSWARYLVKPLSRTLSPRRWRNSSSAGPADSLLYISSSLLWPAMQYIIPTFRWKLSYGQKRGFCDEKQRQLCKSFLTVTISTFSVILMTFEPFCSNSVFIR